MERVTGEVVTAYLGLGANLGNREASLAQAAAYLEDPPNLTLLRSSSIYETAPWGYTEQPDFLNCVLEINTRLSPVALLRRAQDAEQAVGRQPSRRYGPRLIDVDILLYGGLTLRLDAPDLQIPHPRMAVRAFVLVPLAELVGNLAHPVLNRTIADLSSAVEGREGVRLWKPPPLTNSSSP